MYRWSDVFLTYLANGPLKVWDGSLNASNLRKNSRLWPKLRVKRFQQISILSRSKSSFLCWVRCRLKRSKIQRIRKATRKLPTFSWFMLERLLFQLLNFNWWLQVKNIDIYRGCTDIMTTEWPKRSGRKKTLAVAINPHHSLSKNPADYLRCQVTKIEIYQISTLTFWWLILGIAKCNESLVV